MSVIGKSVGDATPATGAQPVYNVDIATGLPAGGVASATAAGGGVTAVSTTPNSAASSAVTPVATTALAGSQIAKASAGNLYGFNVTIGATAGFIMIFDSATVPADGAVTPKKVYAVAASSTTDRTFDVPLRFANGIVLVFSSTGPYTKTISNTAFIESETA